MMGNVKPTRAQVFQGLKFLFKVALGILQVIAAVASESPRRVTAMKAQELYDDGAISSRELAAHLSDVDV